MKLPLDGRCRCGAVRIRMIEAPIMRSFDEFPTMEEFDGLLQEYADWRKRKGPG